MSRSPFRPSTPATMNAADKQNNGHLAKPLTPALSAAFHRSQKSPLTPRLATPGGYRTPKRLAASEHPSSAPSKRDPEPSSSSLLSANVTPRSGSRNSRRDGAVSSPNNNNTPTNGQQSPQVTWTQPHVGQLSNTGRLRTERSPVRGTMLEPSRTTRARTVTMESNHLSRPNSASDNSAGAPMFFHASDARSTISEQEPRPKLQTKTSGTTFIYANGAQERQSPVSEVGGTYKRRSIGLTRSVVSAKPSASPRLRPARVDSNPRLSDGPSVVGSQDDSFEAGSQAHSPPMSSVSARPIPAVRHVKSSSLDSGHSGLSPPHKEGLRPSPLIISPSEPKIDASTIASEPLPGLRPRVFSNGSIASVDTHNSGMQSPSKSESGQANGALNARTERKIMDLEISNSSLLAINRTLEREMRKQNAELRRYRRLSRSGRLSMATSSRSVSGALSIPPEVEEASEHSSVRSPEELSDFSDEDSLEDGVLSPDSQADQDSQHRARDEKRFLIDLAKHQELLADSQRLNQSLKRCLGWTEELIREGQRALEYNVHVNDVQLGGRVLTPEELNELNELNELHEQQELEDISRPSSRSDSEPPSENGS